MDRWVEVGRSEAWVPGRGKAVSVGALRVAVFRDGEDWFAIDDTCPHQGASLAEGAYVDGRVICPLHSWVFDARTGACPRDSHAGVPAYAARCRDGAIEVRVPDPPPTNEAQVQRSPS